MAELMKLHDRILKTIKVTVYITYIKEIGFGLILEQ